MDSFSTQQPPTNIMQRAAAVDENASFCRHTRLYSRLQIEIAREKRAARTLHIVIKTMPDDFNVHLFVDPHTCSCEDLNRLVVMNCKDYEVGMCSDGRFQSLVLVIGSFSGFMLA